MGRTISSFRVTEAEVQEAARWKAFRRSFGREIGKSLMTRYAHKALHIRLFHYHQVV
ncbi:MAG: hypothetical protein JRN56_01860 [Nitrososphaerota archaeon]|jgi:hypothetical protein|nr:hypothetical protein [Nitrososphaerota archaeon]MDG6903797.1 hypothetical protein [Nitrososphaerota archaeon]MDG6911569.1 hypothetical protein [Nitrososphaerota archaeon]MDG6940474.1 hypothetical protein [Nitrososphaerota archaeon]MDG6960784.1 hypothetical protein [Nitrososphaerota archaeon]